MVKTAGLVERGLAEILSNHFSIKAILDRVPLGLDYGLEISSCSNSGSDSYSNIVSIPIGMLASSRMVRKAGTHFALKRLNGYRLLDEEVTTQSSIYEETGREVLQQKVSQYSWAAHAKGVENYEVTTLKAWERVCWHPRSPHFFYIYEFLLTKLQVYLPFTDFEAELMRRWMEALT